MINPENQYYVYIMANKTNVAIYTGFTNNLVKRVYQPKQKFEMGYPERYTINKLVYYEIFSDPENAITREKLIKGYSRARKNSLITSMNPQWRDLYPEIL
ncbi:MAG: GIY-YIG nuclease family protein [Dehalococcoidales bacterium]|nr:GIY-YIG nuclease family protein [Dehalococcoidales bacterium]